MEFLEATPKRWSHVTEEVVADEDD
jgi:hypothetical protein